MVSLAPLHGFHVDQVFSTQVGGSSDLKRAQKVFGVSP
jgi:hypothetical protein